MDDFCFLREREKKYQHSIPVQKNGTEKTKQNNEKKYQNSIPEQCK